MNPIPPKLTRIKKLLALIDIDIKNISTTENLRRDLRIAHTGINNEVKNFDDVLAKVEK